jgi:hypothetical protein
MNVIIIHRDQVTSKVKEDADANDRNDQKNHLDYQPERVSIKIITLNVSTKYN